MITVKAIRSAALPVAALMFLAASGVVGQVPKPKLKSATEILATARRQSFDLKSAVTYKSPKGQKIVFEPSVVRGVIWADLAQASGFPFGRLQVDSSYYYVWVHYTGDYWEAVTVDEAGKVRDRTRDVRVTRQIFPLVPGKPHHPSDTTAIHRHPTAKARISWINRTGGWTALKDGEGRSVGCVLTIICISAAPLPGTGGPRI